MVIWVPVGSKVTVQVRGTGVKDVTCEHCGEQFVYVVGLSGTSTGSNFMWADDSVSQRTREAAARIAQASVKWSTRTVSCPGCGRYQKDMVVDLRQRRARRLALLVLGPVVVAVGALTGVLPGLTGWRTETVGLLAMASIAAAVVAVIAMVVRWDPNAVPQPTGSRPAEGVLTKAEYDQLVQAQQASAEPALIHRTTTRGIPR